MKRKLFSAILFGALLTASTSGLTSCKDYDDDISNLQSQIDKLATADQLSAKVAEMQAAISAAQSAAEAKAAAAQSVADAAKSAAADAAAAASKAQSTADAASKDAAAAAAAAAEVQKAADKAIAELEAKAATKDELKAAADAAEAAVKAIQAAHAADKAAIEKAIADGLAEVKAEIAKTNEALAALDVRLKAVEEKLAAIEAGEGSEEALKAIQEEVEAVSDALEELLGVFTMATSLDLYELNGFNTTLNFYNVVEIENEFPAAMQKATDDADAAAVTGGDKLTFVEGTKRVYNDSLIVRVNPVDAELKAENLCLVNSQGAVLSSDLVEIVSANRYQGAPLTGGAVPTRAAEGQNGLWVIKIKANDKLAEKEVTKAFEEATQLDNKYILFALGVNEPDNAGRRLVTDYKVNLTYGDAPQAAGFNVTTGSFGTKAYTAFRNRWEKNDRGDAVGKDVWKIDYNWKNINVKDKDGVTIVNKEVVLTPAKDKNVTDDDRTDKEVFFVKAGERINIEFDQTKAPIAGFYVTLDWRRANESGKSEINAWNTYTYENVAKVDATTGKVFANTTAKLQRGNNGYITIKSLEQFASVGDIIGFRVFAVNLDGSLVDPDGQAFYVGIKGDTEAEKPVELDAQNITVQFNNTQITGATAAEKATMNVTGKFDAEDAFASEDYNDIKWSVEFKSGTDDNKASALVEGTDYSIKYVKLNGDGDEVYFTPGTAPNYFSDIVKLEMQILNPTKFVDNNTYTVTGDLLYSVGTGSYIVRSVKFDVTKKMPTTMPKEYVISYKAFGNNEIVIPEMQPGNWGAPALKEGKYTSYGKWIDYDASGSDEAKAGKGKWGVDLNWANGVWATFDLAKIYAFPNNKNINTEAWADNKVTYIVKNAVAGKGDNNDSKKYTDLKTTSGGLLGNSGIDYVKDATVLAWIAPNFVNGGTYSVKSTYRYAEISHRKAKWDGAGNITTGADDEVVWNKDNATEQWYDVEADAPSVKLMPWSDKSLVSYKWMQKCVEAANAGNRTPSKWEDDNEIQMPAYGGTITVNLDKVLVDYGKIASGASLPMYQAPTANTAWKTSGTVTSSTTGYTLGDLLNGANNGGKGTYLSVNKTGETGNAANPARLKVWTTAAVNGTELKDAILEFQGFTANGDITFKRIEPTTMSDHEEVVHFEVVDCFGHVEAIDLKIKLVATTKTAQVCGDADGDWYGANDKYRRAK